MKTTIQQPDREETIKKLKMLVGNNPVCLFTTCLSETPLRTRPMFVQRVCDQGNFWFLSTAGSSENNEIDIDPFVQLFFGSSSDAEFLSVYGRAYIQNDPAKKTEIWNPLSGRWFTKDKDHPDTTILKVTPLQIYSWDMTVGSMVPLWTTPDLSRDNAPKPRLGTNASPGTRAVVFKWAQR